jgi:hypothetical protein
MNVQADILRQCLYMNGDLEKKVDACTGGFLASVGSDTHGEILSNVAEGMDTDRIVRLFRCAPFRQDTWRLLDRYSEEIRNRYWRDVVPHWSRHSEAELREIIDCLLKAKRPRAAFHTVQLDWRRVETSRLKSLLFAVATVDAEPADQYPLEAYHISEALSSLNERTSVNPDEMAWLEFIFVEALERSKHGIPNLERQIADSPALFVQVLAFVFKRRNDGQDPPAWQIADPRRREDLASRGYHLLNRLGCIPGTGVDGKINAEALLNWITEVRRLCAEHDRTEAGDEMIGQLLSHAPVAEDGSWPCLPVCEAMEKVASQHIRIGFNVGVHRSRGVTSRAIDEGGVQERDLAAKYRGWAKERAFDFPYVSSVLDSVAAEYDWHAKREDTEVEIEKRLMD